MIQTLARWLAYVKGEVASPLALQIEHDVLVRADLKAGQRHVVVPKGVKRIASSALMDCAGLVGVTIPNTVQSIGKSAFANCTSLRYVRLPKGLISIEPKTFEGCSALHEIQLPMGLQRMGVSAFEGCASLSSVQIPSNVKKLESRTFAGCASLRQIVLPEALIYLGKSVFSRCAQLKTVSLPQTLESMLPYAFAGCTALSSLSIPSTIGEIPHHLCLDCRSLERVELPQGLEKVGESAFQNCCALVELRLPDGVETIEEGAFCGCKSLERIKFPHTLRHICKLAFAHCEMLSQIELPEAIEVIASRAFAECARLSRVALTASHVRVSFSAFEHCEQLDGASKAALAGVTIDDRALDIGFGRPGPAGALSNLTPRAFVFEGVECGSIEGALQSLKFPQLKEQRKICLLSGLEARRAGREQDWKQAQVLYWCGHAFQREESAYQAFLDRLYACVFEQDDSFRQALAESGELPLTHAMGKQDPKETVLTEAEFCGRLMALREKAKAAPETPENGPHKMDRKTLRRRRREYFKRRSMGFRPLEDWMHECLMTTETFLCANEDDWLDSDCGNGYYATTSMCSSIPASHNPEELRRVIERGLFDYVAWFNQ